MFTPNRRKFAVPHRSMYDVLRPILIVGLPGLLFSNLAVIMGGRTYKVGWLR